MEENNELFKDIKKHLIGSINSRRSLVDTLTEICKKFLSRDLMVVHTSQRLGRDKSKKIFSDTHFYKCVKECIIQSYISEEGKQLEPEVILQTLGFVNNAVDWEGYKYKRAKKSTD